jgi:Domain of unknown function (DUF222)
VCGPVADDDLTRRVLPDEFSADEVRAALVLTRRAAHSQFWLAYDLVTRLPQVHAAMDAGVLDEPRARVFSEWTVELSPEQARAVCAELLPRAPGLTTGQLVEQVKKLAIAVDPDWARRRYEQAIADRKVVGYRNADGSANLSGCNLPLDRVAAASGHIDALAKAVKRAGDRRPVDHIRADLFLGMTDGTYTGLDDAAIIQLLTATPAPDADHPDGDTADNDDGEPDGNGSGTEGPGGGGPVDSVPDGAGEAAEGDGDEPVGNEPGGDKPADVRPAGVGPRATVPAARKTTKAGPRRPGLRSPGRTAPQWGRGWSCGCGCPPCWAATSTRPSWPGGGPCMPRSRDLAVTLGGAQWRFAITDEHGQLVHCGITAARPTAAPARAAACRAIVELQVPATALRTLATDPTTPAHWTGVVTDLTRQLDRDTGSGNPVTADADRRTPGAVLRRSLEIRDRSCVMIGCRAPAHTTDKDHTIDHTHGGPTLAPNLGDACRHDHRLKHEGGWQLHQPHAGHFHWTTVSI